MTYYIYRVQLTSNYQVQLIPSSIWMEETILAFSIIRIVVLTMKNHHKAAESWAQSDEAGGLNDEVV